MLHCVYVEHSSVVTFRRWARDGDLAACANCSLLSRVLVTSLGSKVQKLRLARVFILSDVLIAIRAL